MNHNLTYKLDFIDTLSTLAHISPMSNQQVLIAKRKDKSGADQLFVTSNTSDKGVYYTVKTDVDSFNFEGTKFAILSYAQFNKCFSSCQLASKDGSGNPVLETKNSEEDKEPVSVVIKQPAINVVVEHTLASVDCILKPGLYNAEEDSFYDIGVTEESAKFALTNEQLHYIQKMANTVGATNIKFAVNSGLCTITAYNSKTADVFSQTYAVESDPKTPSFTVNISSTKLALLPSSEYKVIIDKEGMIHFAEIRTDRIDVNLYILADA